MGQKINLFIGVLLVVSMGCSQIDTFPEKALADTFFTITGEEVSFKSILKKNEGKTVVLDIWASWCKDCIVGMPKIKSLAKKYPETAFIYISIDRDEKNWKKGMRRFKLTGGQNYWASKGWESDLFEAIDLDWIPRYMVLDKTGKIKLFESTKADDKEIVKQIIALKNEK
ncbi:MAG: TlpA family protein disulfide reductase [Aurantibacter sp.]